MRVKVYQIDFRKDVNRVGFESYDYIMKHEGKIDPSIYRLVYFGDIDATSLEDAFRIFNLSIPGTYQGHSLSVSDIVEVVEDWEVDEACYFCDSVGFKKLDDFDSSKCGDMEGQKVVYIAPNRTPIVIRIKDSLEAHQHAVGGMIEYSYPFDDGVVVCCNEEGKLIGMKGNRRIGGNIYVGPIFLIQDDNCGGTESLTDAQVKKYCDMFAIPEYISEEEIQDDCFIRVMTI